MKPADHRAIFRETVHGFFEPMAWVATTVASFLGWKPTKRSVTEPLSAGRMRSVEPPQGLEHWRMMDRREYRIVTLFLKEDPHDRDELIKWLIGAAAEARQVERDTHIRYIKRQPQWSTLVSWAMLDRSLLGALRRAQKDGQHDLTDAGRLLLALLIRDLHKEAFARHELVLRSSRSRHLLVRTLSIVRLYVMLRLRILGYISRQGTDKYAATKHEN